MIKKHFIILLAALMLAAPLSVSAAEVASGSIYCFSGEDFAEAPLEGVCITALPENGAVLLDTRIIMPGDILTAGQLSRLTFCPADTETGSTATVEYLPIFQDRVDPPAQLTISILGKKNKAPEARDVQLETYKNIPNEGRLKATDPEGKPLSFTILRQPRRGKVALAGDGSFVYTPGKNKVGVDSFTYTATDPAGNVSEEATVTVKILKPADSARYSDTVGLSCRFEAEWLRATGLFVGEQVGGKACFQPEKPVTRGEFTAMLLEALDFPLSQETGLVGSAQNAPAWLRPYIAAALRSGLLTGLSETAGFDVPITGLDAAVMLQNALDLAVTETLAGADADPALQALAVMNENGFALEADTVLTRADLACILYRFSVTDAPGKAVFAQ